MIMAMQHPLYRDVLLGDGYRREIESRMKISNFADIGVRPTVDPEPTSTDPKAIGVGGHRSYVVSSEEMELSQDVVRLKGELEGLQESAAIAERFEQYNKTMATARIPTERVMYEAAKPQPFATYDDFLAAIRDPDYSRSTSYRNAVEARAAVSNF
jgi:hypothetical protein